MKGKKKVGKSKKIGKSVHNQNFGSQSVVESDINFSMEDWCAAYGKEIQKFESCFIPRRRLWYTFTTALCPFAAHVP